MIGKTHGLVFCLALLAGAPALAQETFTNPDAAADALIGAAKVNDQSAILTVLGPGAGEIINSGDPVAQKMGSFDPGDGWTQADGH